MYVHGCKCICYIWIIINKFIDNIQCSLTQDNAHVKGLEAINMQNVIYELGEACRNCVYDCILRPCVVYG